MRRSNRAVVVNRKDDSKNDSEQKNWESEEIEEDEWRLFDNGSRNPIVCNSWKSWDEYLSKREVTGLTLWNIAVILFVYFKIIETSEKKSSL